MYLYINVVLELKLDSPGIEPGASPVRGAHSADELRALNIDEKPVNQYKFSATC